MKARLFALGLSAAMAVSPLAMGCGTILGHAGEQDLNVHLSPDDPEAEVSINGIPRGKGSGVYKIESTRDGNTITGVKCPDGKVGAGGVHRELMPFVIVADAFMLIFPIYIDYLDGGAYSLQREININTGKAADTSNNSTDFQKGTSNLPNANNGGEQVQESKPCPFCGELRPVNAANCPHCGQH